MKIKNKHIINIIENIRKKSMTDLLLTSYLYGHYKSRLLSHVEVKQVKIVNRLEPFVYFYFNPSPSLTAYSFTLSTFLYIIFLQIRKKKTIVY